MMLRISCVLPVLACIILSSGQSMCEPKPFFTENFENYPASVSDAESFTGKCFSTKFGDYSAKIDNAQWRKAGSISFWCKGANLRTALNDVIAMKSSVDPDALFSFYPGVNAAGFLDFLCKVDQFMGDPLDWHNLILSWDSNTAAFYLDGIPMIEKSANSSPTYEKVHIKIEDKFDTLIFKPVKGILINHVELFDAPLDDADAHSVYTSAISQAEHKTITLIPAKSIYPSEEEKTDFSKEPWFGIKKGIDHSVPAPWTKVAVTDTSFKCWGREYGFDALGITHMTSGGDQILSSPAKIFVVNEQGKKITPKAISAPVLTSKFADKADYSTSADWGSIEVDQKIAAEFDGFIKYTITVKPKKSVVISGLGVELPVSAQFSKYMNIFGSFSSYLYSPFRCPDLKKGKDFWWRFEPYIMAENEDKGLCFMVESEKNCRWVDRSKVVGFVEDGSGGRKLIFNFINGNTRLDPKTAGDGIVYEFAVQALPVKPMLKDYRNFRVSARLGEQGVDKRNTVVPGVPWFWHSPWPSFREFDDQLPQALSIMKDAVNKGEIKKAFETPYINFQKYGAEAVGIPMEPYAVYKNVWNMSAVGESLTPVDLKTYPLHEQSQLNTAYDYSNYKVGVDISCKIMEICQGAKTFGNFFLWEFCQLMNKYPDLNGIYIDETFSYGCSSEAHGCGWRTAKGSLLGRYPIFENRELRKRWYKVARAYHKDFLFWTHDSAFIKPPQMAYSDFTSSGETIGYQSGDPLDTIDLREFRIEYLGKQVGVPQFLLPEVYRETEEEPTRKLVALLMLHDIQTWEIWANREAVTKVWAMMNNFGMDDSTRFIPYWSDKPYSIVSGKDVLSSAFLKDKSAFVIVVNTSKSLKSIDLHIKDALPIKDVYPQKTKITAQSPGKVSMTLEPRDSAILVFGRE